MKKGGKRQIRAKDSYLLFDSASTSAARDQASRSRQPPETKKASSNHVRQSSKTRTIVKTIKNAVKPNSNSFVESKAGKKGKNTLTKKFTDLSHTSSSEKVTLEIDELCVEKP